MIDHLMKFDSEEEAKADPVTGAYFVAGDGGTEGGWRGDVCFPAQQFWRLSGNTADPESGEEMIHPLPGWYITIGDTGVVPQLRDHANCLLVTNRDANPQAADFLLGGTLDAAGLADYRLAPLPAGARDIFVAA